MGNEQMTDLEMQNRLITQLLDSGEFQSEQDVEHLQTHISHVILAGDYAYKIKKPLDLGFLDFSTLERRKFCCEEELRLNRRLAEALYLEVVPITGSLDFPVLGGEGKALEYAVKMRRFSQSGLLSQMPPDRESMIQLAELVADFHLSIPQTGKETPFGGPDHVVQPMLENFHQIREIAVEPLNLQALDSLEAWTQNKAEQVNGLLQKRKQAGHIRECHGDMHLGNITRYQGKLQVFDGIEFNPNLSWIDTINDVAFLIMDLHFRGLYQEAALFLNEYLARSGDYAGVPLLHFYQLYRAMVRAKVAAIRLAQSGLNVQEAQQIQHEFSGYLQLAETYTQQAEPRLFITHGLSGSGKSLFSGWLSERLPAIRIRSDVERKRLFSITSSGQGLEQGIYSPASSQATYAHLRDLAGLLLRAGYTVIVDAAFLKAAQREPFMGLAEELKVPYRILDCVAPDDVLRQRILARQQKGADPSDADLQVLELQMRNHQPLSGEEREQSIRLDTTQSPSPALLDQLITLNTSD